MICPGQTAHKTSTYNERTACMNAYKTRITDTVLGISINDTDIDLFESQYPVPGGVSYNS